jgi:hypothetical protein
MPTPAAARVDRHDRGHRGSRHAARERRPGPGRSGARGDNTEEDDDCRSQPSHCKPPPLLALVSGNQRGSGRLGSGASGAASMTVPETGSTQTR